MIVLKLSIFLTFFFPKNYRTHKQTGSRFSKIHGVFPFDQNWTVVSFVHFARN